MPHRVIVIGEPSAGKSTLISSLCGAGDVDEEDGGGGKGGGTATLYCQLDALRLTLNGVMHTVEFMELGSGVQQAATFDVLCSGDVRGLIILVNASVSPRESWTAAQRALASFAQHRAVDACIPTREDDAASIDSTTDRCSSDAAIGVPTAAAAQEVLQQLRERHVPILMLVSHTGDAVVHPAVALQRRKEHGVGMVDALKLRLYALPFSALYLDGTEAVWLQKIVKGAETSVRLPVCIMYRATTQPGMCCRRRAMLAVARGECCVDTVMVVRS